MVCIFCGNKKTSVTNSRPQDKGTRTWRRRSCQKCLQSFTTNEIADDSELQIINSNNEATPFNTGRLIISIYSCFLHDQDSGSSASYWLALSIKQTLVQKLVEDELISSRDIAKATHEALSRFDNVAAIQYAAREGLL